MKAINKTKLSEYSCGSLGVCLEPVRPDAKEVGIAGSFNDWHPSVTSMIGLKDGRTLTKTEWIIGVGVFAGMKLIEQH